MKKYIRWNKYNASTCRCNQNHTHDSRGEAAYCDDLALLKVAGEIQDYEIQVKIPLMINGKTICNHYIDFLVTNKEGNLEYREYKGFITDTWRIKKKLTEALYPDIPYIVIKHYKR